MSYMADLFSSNVYYYAKVQEPQRTKDPVTGDLSAETWVDVKTDLPAIIWRGSGNKTILSEQERSIVRGTILFDPQDIGSAEITDDSRIVIDTQGIFYTVLAHDVAGQGQVIEVFYSEDRYAQG